jgi:hypothetical protein
MLIGDKRWRANYLRTTHTGGFSLLHPPPALRPQLAGWNLVYYRREDLNNALREGAILSFKVDTPVSHAWCRYSENFRGRGRRTEFPDLLCKWLRCGQVCDLRPLRRSADYAEHHGAVVIFHRARTLNCNVTHAFASQLPPDAARFLCIVR